MFVMGRTIIEKLWDEHSVADLGDGTHLIYIDRVFFHERTGSIALKGLEAAGRKVRNPEQVFGCMDHIVDTIPGRTDNTMVPGGIAFITETRAAAEAAGVHLFDLGDERQGIVHVVSPEQGIAVPGVTLVCPDSHTCTQGALGALAWGIGSTEAEHAMATKTLVVKKPQQMRVRFEGRRGHGVTAKDLILHLIGTHTASGGVGYAIEFAGEAIHDMPMEARFTLCNMAVEFGAWTGIIAPDETTYAYSEGRPFAPQGDMWDRAVEHWRTLPSDDDARFDKEIVIDCADIVPQVTWGTSPQHETGIDGTVPDPTDEPDENRRRSMEKALAYMDLEPGMPLEGLPIDSAFIGSCTNSRLSDLRNAAAHPERPQGSRRRQGHLRPRFGAGQAGGRGRRYRQNFSSTPGFEWREPGCSMCFFRRGRDISAMEPTGRFQHEPQFRKSPGPANAHPSCQPDDPSRRRPIAAAVSPMCGGMEI